MYWYWSLLARAAGGDLDLASSVCWPGITSASESLKWLDNTMIHVPLLNKFYGAIKQVNESFATGKKNCV